MVRSFGSRFASPRGMLTPFVTFVLFMSVVGGTLAVNDPVAPEPAPVALAEGVPVAVAGTLLGVADGHLAVQEPDAAGPVAFPLAARTEVLRGGEAVALDALRQGDELRMSVDGATGRVLRVDAVPAARPPFAPSNELALLAAIGLVSGGVLLAARTRRPEPTARRGRRLAVGPTGRRTIQTAHAAVSRATAARQPNRAGARS